MPERTTFSTEGNYQIEVKGNLDTKWGEWFDGFEILPQLNDITLLSGTVPDQAALHGTLAKIRDLGLPLISVKRIPMDDSEGI